MKRTLVSVVIGFAITSITAAACEQPAVKPKFTNEPGWTWHVPPADASWALTTQQGMVMRLDELKEDKLLLTLARTRTGESDREIVLFRPVAFDSAGQRFEFKADSGGSVEGVALNGYVLDLKSRPRHQIKSVGIEKLTRENLQDFVAPAAFRKLKEAGVQALAFPVVGERFEFELTTVDGKRISSEALRGEVVLLDFWAKWCGPCMAKMPKLRQTYEKLHDRGFEIVGLNHDYTLEQARRVIADQKLSWPNVVAPIDNEQRHAWFEATGTGSLPRLLLLDRKGILRAEVSPHNLDAEIEKLMNQPVESK